MSKAFTRGTIFALLLIGVAILAVRFNPIAASSPKVAKPDDFETPRPIAVRETLWVEDMTWMEARDAIAAGKDTIIIATGGVEQNGPYVVSGKHNLVIQVLAQAIAEKLGDTLIAPIVPFVPEGPIDPPDGHMLYPPTISVEDETYRALLSDIARSFHAHGFRQIIFIGDSGGNQEGMAQVAEELDQTWKAEGTRIFHIPEFYDWDARIAWINTQGYEQVSEGIHDDLSVQAILMTLDPNTIRLEERRAVGLASINGVSVESEEEIAALGRGLVEYVAAQTVEAIRSREAAVE